MSSLTAYDHRLLKSQKLKETKITLLNVSKCNVPRICHEIRLFNAYDDQCDELWKSFKEIETSLWLADHRQREAEKENPTIKVDKEEKETKTETPKPPTNAGSAGASKYAGTVPLADWAFTTTEEETLHPEHATAGLSFTDIKSYSLYQLRQAMKEYNLEEEGGLRKAKEHYKNCESLMAILVKLLIDPKRKRMDKLKVEQDTSKQTDSTKNTKNTETTTGNQDQSDNQDNSKETAMQEQEKVVITNATKTKPQATDPHPSKETMPTTTTVETSSDGKKVIVRRGTDITYDNCPTLSIYELRQELVRRNAFDAFLNGKKKINFKNMLRVLQSLLLNDRKIIDEKHAQETWEKPEDIKARLVQAKIDRKAEAMERSVIRQAERKEQEKIKEELGDQEEENEEEKEEEEVTQDGTQEEEEEEEEPIKKKGTHPGLL